MNYIKRITINFFLFMLFVTGTFAYSISGKIKEKPLVAIVCSYNNIKWAKKNLDTIFFNGTKIIA